MTGSPPNVLDLPGDYDALDLLARRAAEGDESAFAALVERLQPAVFRWALPYSTTRDDAEDLVQEAFVLAHRHLRSYRGPRALAAWFRQITRRAAVRSSTRRRRRAALTAQPAYWLERVVYTTDPGARVDRERLVAAVRLAWEELPAQQRAVLDLVDLQGRRPVDAAREMGLRDVTLRANLFKARRFVRTRVLHAMGDPSDAEIYP